MRAYSLTASDKARLERDFSYHSPDPEQPQRYTLLRDTAKSLAELILTHTPRTREQSLALTNLEQAVMWANAAIARGESEHETRLKKALLDAPQQA